MKDLNLLVFLTQLGLSVAAPLAGFVLLGVWLHESLGWGRWTIWAGLALGIVCAVEGLRWCLRILAQMSGPKKDTPPPPTAYNDHE